LAEIEATADTTVKELKRVLKNQYGWMQSSFVLYFNHKRMSEDSTLTSHGIRNQSTLYLYWAHMRFNQICVEYPNGDDEAYNWNHDFLNLQKEIETRIGIPIDDQLLYHGDKLVDNYTNVQTLPYAGVCVQRKSHRQSVLIGASLRLFLYRALD
jgi:hypothetical protein